MEIGEEMMRKVQERWREYGFVKRGAASKVACPLFFSVPFSSLGGAALGRATVGVRPCDGEGSLATQEVNDGAHGRQEHARSGLCYCRINAPLLQIDDVTQGRP